MFALLTRCEHGPRHQPDRILSADDYDESKGNVMKRRQFLIGAGIGGAITGNVLLVQYLNQNKQPINGLTAKPNADENGIRCMAFSLHGNLLASAHKNGEMSIWNASSQEVIVSIPTNQGLISGMGFQSPEDWVATIAEGAPFVVARRPMKDISSLSLYELPINPTVLAMSPALERGTEPPSVQFAVGLENHAIQIMGGSLHGRFSDGASPPGHLHGHTAKINDLAFSPFKGSFLASASDDGSVRLWSVKTWEEVFTPPWQFRDRVLTVSFSNDSQSFVCGLANGELLVHDRKANKTPISAPSKGGAIIAAKFLRGRHWIITLSSDAIPRIWSMNGKLREVAMLPASLGRHPNLAVSADEKTLAIAMGRSVKFLDIDSIISDLKV